MITGFWTQNESRREFHRGQDQLSAHRFGDHENLIVARFGMEEKRDLFYSHALILSRHPPPTDPALS